MALRHIQKAFIEHGTSPRERIYSAWYAALFFRSWKYHLAKETSDQRDVNLADKITLQRNFVSPNFYTGVELNGHELTIFHNKCRDMKKPQLFLPSYLNSQGCEGGFRTYRSMSSSDSTVTNMDMLDMLLRSNRLTIMEQAPVMIKEFCLKEKKAANIFVPQELLTDEDINSIVEDGYEQVKTELFKFGKFFLPQFKKFVRSFYEFKYFRLHLGRLASESPTQSRLELATKGPTKGRRIVRRRGRRN